MQALGSTYVKPRREGIRRSRLRPAAAGSWPHVEVSAPPQHPCLTRVCLLSGQRSVTGHRLGATSPQAGPSFRSQDQQRHQVSWLTLGCVDLAWSFNRRRARGSATLRA